MLSTVNSSTRAKSRLPAMAVHHCRCTFLWSFLLCKQKKGQGIKTKPRLSTGSFYPFRAFHHFTSCFNNNDIPKLTIAPITVSTIVFKMSALLMFASNTSNVPPMVVAFVCIGSLILFQLNKPVESCYLSFLTAVWLTVLATVPATAR